MSLFLSEGVVCVVAMPGTKISSHAGNDKAWVWSAVDFADEEQKVEMFAIRFGSVERAPPCSLHSPAICFHV